MGWRTDWLYQLIFDEVERIWTRAIKQSTFPIMGPPPDFLLIQECGDANWEHVVCRPPVLRKWTYCGEEFEPLPLAPPQPLAPAVKRGAFYSHGVVTFHIWPDRKKLVFGYVLGPLDGRGNVFLVVGQGRRGTLRGRLEGDPDSIIWIS